MLFDRLRTMFDRTATHTGDRGEHAAVVDLLVLAMYADHTLRSEELESLTQFDSSHADWDDGAFSVQQHLKSSIARARAAIDDPAAVDALLAEIGQAIQTPAARTEALAACEEILRADGELAAAESTFLTKARTALA
jgi:hypothetical protein